ncbi:MAG: RNA-protein complex protein Nop10 [Candidatus Aenigmatarchaeota archaeon]
MPKIMKKCTKCNSYSLSEKCPSCESKTSNPHPAKFSPEDRHGKYRRIAKLIKTAE